MRQSRITLLRRRYLVLLAAMLAVSACGGAPETTDEATADVAAETAGEDATEAAASDAGEPAAEGGDVSAAGGAAVLPDWVPDDVYLPEEYSVGGAMDVGDVQRLELQVAGSVAGVTEQARAGMQAHGWTEGPGTGESTVYTKGQRNVMLTVNDRGDGSTRVGYQFSTL